MPHISPTPIKDHVSKKLYDFLFSALTDRKVPQKQQRLAFQELLTPTEKIMLGKRLLGISLLSQGMSPYRVGKVLQLSSTTTTKLQDRLDRGKLSNTEKLCKALEKGPLQNYLDNLLKPLPR